jgi:hypothetical protein
MLFVSGCEDAINFTPAVVTSVTINGGNVSVAKGGTKAFTATVGGTNGPSQAVTWSIETEEYHENTEISETGVLTVSEEEAAASLTVRATSTSNSEKYGEVTVTITEASSGVTSVTIEGGNVSVNQGGTVDFVVTVEGTNNPAQTVTWSIVETTHHTDTTIDNAGHLAIDAAESATTLTIRATSTVDTSKYGDVTVTVTTGGSTAATVTSVGVSGDASVAQGQSSAAFTAKVGGINSPAQTVTWSIVGSHHTATSISTDGVLTVSGEETAASLTVRATSTANTTKYGEVTVTVTVGSPSVTSVTINEGNVSVERGGAKDFTATVVVKFGAAQTVTWSVEGAHDGDTIISESGRLSVSPAETVGSKLTIRAASTVDETKYADVTVTVTKNDAPYIETQGARKLVSQGKATVSGAKTYYLDAENGNDTNDGLSPLKPWKSFKNVNAKTFSPGDHILLEADSIWNGEPVTTTNRTTLLASDKVGMLFPKGSGAEGKPIVIDLYDIDNFSAAQPVVFYSANKRPIINGNGTPSSNDTENPYAPSGAIHLESPQSYWEIYNMECTNTFENPLTNPNHWYNMAVRKGLAGILLNTPPNSTVTGDYHHFVVKNCYVHDVQSESTNNKSKGQYTLSNYFGGDHNASKVVGGILQNASGYNGIWFEGNIVKKVGLEGVRTSANSNSNVYIRGNYIEAIAGDGIVLSSTLATGDALVENNIIKDSCAAPNTGTANYAACWAYIVKGGGTLGAAIFQYNEAYGTLYGYLDGEAWDIDNSCDKVIYQYNYSHHNAGGTILFMSGITDGVFRYNISANDGGGSRYMATVADGTGALPVDTNADSYKRWSAGQTLFHYVNTTTSAVRGIPLIYNNTFYIGDGITCGIFGHNDYSAITRYVRFYNNIVLKAGTGTVYLVYGSGGETNYAGSIYNDVGFANNIIWGYGTDPSVGDYTKFNNGTGTSPQTLFGKYSNKWKNPNLRIQRDAANVTALREQRDSALPPEAYTDPAALAEFTSKERLRSRASLFTPVTASAVSGGRRIPAGGNTSDTDGAWSGDEITEDMFGAKWSATSSSGRPIGAAARAYNN